ncbi:MAG: 3-deoxy-7-phosphoheptulonate synthase, partial [Microcystaceae cyanobacterium]
MIIIVKNGTPADEMTRISEELCDTWGVTVEKSVGKHKVVLGLVGETATIDPLQIQNSSPWIEQVLRVERPFKRVSREFRHGEASEVVVPTPNGSVHIGEQNPIVLVAGPCSVENEAMIVETAKRVKAGGAKFLRGGAYK